MSNLYLFRIEFALRQSSMHKDEVTQTSSDFISKPGDKRQNQKRFLQLTKFMHTPLLQKNQAVSCKSFFSNISQQQATFSLTVFQGKTNSIALLISPLQSTSIKQESITQKKPKVTK
jgi:hypothetical protein